MEIFVRSLSQDSISLSTGELSRSTVGTLVISPTRELATQIANESIKCLTWHKLYNTQLLVGGASRRQQIRLWRRDRKDVVVATPGRLKDLLQDPEMGESFAEALSKTGTVCHNHCRV